MVGGPKENVFSLSADSASAANPRKKGELFAFKGGFEVFDTVRSGDPGGSDFGGFCVTSGVLGVGNSGDLHPADVFYVVEMAVFVNGCGWDGEVVAIDGSGSGCHKGPRGSEIDDDGSCSDSVRLVVFD